MKKNLHSSLWRRWFSFSSLFDFRLAGLQDEEFECQMVLLECQRYFDCFPGSSVAVGLFRV
jgi:hypothetical protein